MPAVNLVCVRTAEDPKLPQTQGNRVAEPTLMSIGV